MRFFLDHDVPDVAGRVLIGSGHEVTLLREVAGITITDAEALRMAGWQYDIQD